MDPQQIKTDACDGFEVGWGITPDNFRILLITPMRNGVSIGRPLGVQVDRARSLVTQLQRNIALAEAWKGT